MARASKILTAGGTMLENEVRAHRGRLGWSQEELARRAGLSRAGISAIESGRLAPSTASALALASALGCTVEALFRLSGVAGASAGVGASAAEEWAWAPPAPDWRYWRAEVGGRRYRYPVETSLLGLVPHDGTFRDGAALGVSSEDPSRTLVLACCDPAVGLLAAELARRAEVRLVVVRRSSGEALDLLARGLVHAAGAHLARADALEGNAEMVRARLDAGAGPVVETAGSRQALSYQVLHVADWEEGIALGPRAASSSSVRDVLAAPLRWALREPGSGARQCLDEAIEGEGARSWRPAARSLQALDHRGVADAIRSASADAGICLRLNCEEAGLRFLTVRREAYDLCFPETFLQDARGQALLGAVRSRSYRRLLADLPGYDPARAGDLGDVPRRRDQTR